MACPFCGNALPVDVHDGQLIVCLGCAAHLRRKGDAVEVDTAPPGEAVPAAVEREDTDRAIVAASAEPARAAAVRHAASAVGDDPEALPPLLMTPAAAAFEPNAPSAPTPVDDDLTPPVGVPIPPPRTPVPAATPRAAASPAPSPPQSQSSPSQSQSRSPSLPTNRSRARTIVVVALLALVAAAIAASFL